MRVFNKRYWPHQFRLERPERSVWQQYTKDPALTEIESWCYDNIKSRDWNNVGYYFVFKQGADATAFALRWS